MAPLDQFAQQEPAQCKAPPLAMPSNDTCSSPSSGSEQSRMASSTPSTPSSPQDATSAVSVRGILSSIRISQSPHKKRRREQDHDSDDAALIKAAPPPSHRALHQAATGKANTTNAPPLTATHEIRFLRKEVAEMEQQLQQLETKWATRIPNDNLLFSACHAAKEKWTTTQVEQVNGSLKDQLTQQQFLFASLQSALLQAPLQSPGREMFEAVHLSTVLPHGDDRRRVEALQAHCDKGIATAPETIAKFCGHIASSSTPYSQTSITGGADHTFVSSVFVLEIPHGSLLDVFHATLGYYVSLPLELQKYVATTMEIQPLNLLNSLRQYIKVKLANELFTTTVNTTFAAKIVDGIAVIHSDVIVSDPLHPTPADEPVSRIGVNAVTLTPVTDLETGKVCKVVLRRVLVYRYNLLPHHAAVQKDMKQIQCIVNGDLLTALICKHLQQHKPNDDAIAHANAGRYGHPPSSVGELRIGL